MKKDASSWTLSVQRDSRESKNVLPSVRVRRRVAKRFSPTCRSRGLSVIVEVDGVKVDLFSQVEDIVSNGRDIEAE